MAWGGTHIKAWAQSTDNVSEPDGRPIGVINKYPAGAPYRILRAALRLYGSIYGVRSVLWLQGETDAKAINEIGDWGTRAVDNADDYKNRLQRVIEQTRTDFGPVPWIVGQTSIIGGVEKDSLISILIANGQNLAVNTAATNSGLQISIGGSSVGSQVFSGPDMNNSVTVRRTSGGDEPVHFRRFDSSDNTDGLAQAGEAWFNSLNAILSSQSSNRIRPVIQARIGTEYRTLSIDEPASTVSAPSGYQQVMWVADNNGTFDLASPVGYGQTISSNGSGRLRAVLTDNQGNKTLTQAINLPYSLVDDTGDSPVPPSGQTCKNGNENSAGNRTPNGATVGGFGNSSEFMEYTFTGQTGGSTNFTIHYASGDPQAGIMLVVNGTSVPLYRPGTASWTPNADASTTISLIGGNNTIRIQGSGDGNFSYDRICIGSGSTLPSGCVFSIAPTVSNGNPACGQGLNLLANCSGADCGGVTFSWSGNGQTYSGISPGITAPISNGNVTYTLTASKSGCGSLTNSTSINQINCGTTPPFSIAGVQLNCSTGVVTMSFNSSNGSTIEYKAVGLQDWSSNQLVVPSWQRNNTSFTFYARQSGVEANVSFGSTCAGYRMATQSAEAVGEGLWVSPNPTSGKVVARFTLNEGQRATLSVVTLTGQSLQTRSVLGTGKAQDETLDLSSQAGGLYVVRLETAAGAKTAKVVLQR